jgi:hypothetical protein
VGRNGRALKYAKYSLYNSSKCREIKNLTRELSNITALLLLRILCKKVNKIMATTACVLVRFDADLARVQEETKLERNMKEKAIREKDLSVSERIQLEQELEVRFNILLCGQCR